MNGPGPTADPSKRYVSKTANADRRGLAWRVGLGAALAFAAGWWLGEGVGTQFSGWWNRNTGFATFIGGVLVFAATVTYAVFTYGLVRVGQDSLQSAFKSNELTRIAVDEDRKLYKLMLKGRIDALLPVVSMRVRQIALVQENGLSLGTVAWSIFVIGTYRLALTIEVTNHGPGAAVLIPPDAAAGTAVGLNTGENRPWSGPFVIAEGQSVEVQLGVGVEGQIIDHDWPARFARGESVVELLFRTESAFEKAAHDEHSLRLSVSVEAQDGQFIPSSSVNYRLPSHELLTERKYPSELN